MHEQFLHSRQCRREKPGFIIPVSLLQHSPLRIDFTEYFCSDRFFAHVFLFFVIAAVISVLKGFLHLRKLFNLIFGQYHMPQYSSSLKNRNRVQFRQVSVLSASGFYFSTNEQDFRKKSNQHIPSRIRKRLFYMPYAYP